MCVCVCVCVGGCGCSTLRVSYGTVCIFYNKIRMSKTVLSNMKGPHKKLFIFQQDLKTCVKRHFRKLDC